MIRRWMAAFVVIVLGAAGVVALAPQSVMAETTCDKNGMFLTLKPWYYGVTNDDCSIQAPTIVTSGLGGEKNAFFWAIGLNIVEDLLQIVAYATVGFMMYGGFLFLTSAGAPEKATAGRKTILNVAVAMIIAMFAVTLVNLVARRALGIQ